MAPEKAEAIVKAVDGFHLEQCFSKTKGMEDSVDDLDQDDPPLLNVPGIRKTFCVGLGQ